MQTLKPPTLMFTLAAGLLLASPFVESLRGEDFPPVAKLEPQAELPDPLKMWGGSKVTTKEQWAGERRPELKRLFQHYMYGFLPPKPARVETQVSEPRPCLGGKGTLRQATIHFVEPKLAQQLHILLITPAKAESPPPVFIGMNFCGNQAVIDDPAVELPKSWVYARCAGAANERATDKGRGTEKDTWNVELILDRGYAFATFYSGDIDPDTADFSDGIAPAFYKAGPTMPAADDPGTIACWAWGFHRVVDFLSEAKTPLIDPQRIAVVGHSRNGKTALLAAAMDERIALSIPSQAGCGGTAPSRGTVGESVQRINTSFPHWFCDEFTLFNDNPALLPFDQNCLLALCAPRPVLFANAQEDTWANPDGQFQVLQAAEPVYKLLGTDGLADAKAPEMSKLVGGRLGYFIRPGKHSMTRLEWEAYLDFADKHLKSQ